MLKIYGTRDNLVKFEGQINEKFYCYEVSLELSFIDGTVARISCRKEEMDIWKIDMISKGDYFDRLEECFNEETKVYSDVLYMKDYNSPDCLLKEIKEI